MTITKDTLLTDIPATIISGVYSNGVQFNQRFRATVHAIVQRGYYDGVDDIVTHAEI